MDERAKRRHRHDRHRRAPRRARARGSRRRPAGPRRDRRRPRGRTRAKIAQFSPRWGSSGRPAAIARSARSIAVGRRAQVHHLVHRQRGERGGLQHVACRAARISQGGDRRVGLAPRRRRGVADAQQRDLELLARRLPGREPLLGAAQDRRSFGGAAGEEQHAAELDRRRRDRRRVLAALDDLRQRGDRLRRAGAGVRLAELEQRRRRARRQREARRGHATAAPAAPAASPSASASRAASRSSATAPRVGGGLGVHDVRRDLAGGRPALAQDLRRRAMQPLALGGRQVAVDRRAQDRVGEADRAAGFHDAGGDQRRHRRLEVGAAESGQPRGVAHLRAVAEHAERAGERRGRRRQPRQDGAAPRWRRRVGRSRRHRPRRPRCGSMPRAAASSSSSPSRNGLPPVTSRQARTNRSSGSLDEPGGDQCADGRLRQRRRAQQLGTGIGDERRRLGRQRRIERPGGEDQRERLRPRAGAR